jgi:hypothetical protein
MKKRFRIGKLLFFRMLLTDVVSNIERDVEISTLRETSPALII